MMNAQSKLNLQLRPAKRAQELSSFDAFGAGMKVRLCACLVLVVFGAFHHNQVGRIVVAAVAIPVMHNLISFERTAQRLLGNYPVFVLKSLAHFGDNLVATAGKMTALPTGMFSTIKALDRSLSYGAFAELFKAGGAKSLITECAVFLRGHTVYGFQMTSRYLHTTNLAAQFTFDRSLKLIHRCLLTVVYRKVVTIAT